MKRFVIFILCNTLLFVMLYAQNKFILTSPDKKLQTTIECGQQLKYNIVYENHYYLIFHLFLLQQIKDAYGDMNPVCFIMK